ncbi:Heat shock factor-binding protein 1 [Toxocara canis]|uniref:Heat shock factor-binding protein 1 n=2 Tax=Toxocara canis TaxID=6265 RepID=A0A0B2VVH3_TOXCA|nr:Heat shock factor-binding protein 1 [Toxocara canis]VDM45834.1 unnamed protein product [Toxocara canis]
MDKAEEPVSKVPDAPAVPELKAGDPNSLQELTALIQGVLQQTQDRFQHMSDQIVGRIDEMTKRIDELEKNITDLMNQAGVEPEP